MEYMIILNEYKNITNNLFYEGKIRLGSIDNLIWDDIYDKLTSLPNTMLKVNQQIEKEKNTLQNINNELEEIEKRKQILLQQVKEQENKISQLQDTVKCWDTFSSFKYENFTQVAENCKEIENTLSTRLHEQITKDSNAFVDMNDDSDNPKLSLVFNLVGLSPETISALSEYDAKVFVDCWGDSETITLQEAKDILYCKKMLKKGMIPYTNHEEECPVCNCKNADELFELFEEYKLDISLDFLKKHELNGKRLLGLSVTDVKQYFEIPKDNIMPLMKSICKFKDLHKQYLNK